MKFFKLDAYDLANAFVSNFAYEVNYAVAYFVAA